MGKAGERTDLDYSLWSVLLDAYTNHLYHSAMLNLGADTTLNHKQCIAGRRANWKGGQASSIDPVSHPEQTTLCLDFSSFEKGVMVLPGAMEDAVEL